MKLDRQTLTKMIRAACVLEATARKPGNVHPEAAFEDLCYDDFVRAGNLVAPILADAERNGVGATILEAVTQTQAELSKNVNLGIILLLAPLAAVPSEQTLAEGLPPLLRRLDRRDAELVYEAIRRAQPGGMGHVDEQDIAQAPTETLLEVMQLAAERDQIAAEYAHGFPVVLEYAREHFDCAQETPEQWSAAIVHLQLKLLSRFGDSLIARKCGPATSEECRDRARVALRAFEERGSVQISEIGALDDWLRGDGHRRNPGTTADLIAAILFAAFREGYVAQMSIPPQSGLRRPDLSKEEFYQNKSIVKIEWWLHSCDLPSLTWARLQVFSDGTADSCFDPNDTLYGFSTRDSASHFLSEDEFIELSQMDHDDEKEYGFVIASIIPPVWPSDSNQEFEYLGTY